MPSPRSARRNAQRQTVRQYDQALAVACEQTKLQYKGVPYTPHGEKDWSIHEPNALGKQIPDAGRFAFPAQSRANGKPL